jgi:hypothetical protein
MAFSTYDARNQIEAKQLPQVYKLAVLNHSLLSLAHWELTSNHTKRQQPLKHLM